MLDEEAIATTGLNSACILTSFKGFLNDLVLPRFNRGSHEKLVTESRLQKDRNCRLNRRLRAYVSSLLPPSDPAGLSQIWNSTLSQKALAYSVTLRFPLRNTFLFSAIEEPIAVFSERTCV